MQTPQLHGEGFSLCAPTCVPVKTAHKNWCCQVGQYTAGTSVVTTTRTNLLRARVHDRCFSFVSSPFFSGGRLEEDGAGLPGRRLLGRDCVQPVGPAQGQEEGAPGILILNTTQIKPDLTVD